MIYLDHCATTAIRREVLKSMLPFLKECFGNPSSLHGPGTAAKTAMEAAREQVAGLIGAEPSEIYFTSGGTEANNLAIQGAAAAFRKRGDHIITSAIEHPSVLETCKCLERAGLRVTCLPVDGRGSVDPDELRRTVTGKTILISIMHGNNEVGTLQPVREIGRIAAESEIPFHTDAVQTAGKIAVNVSDLSAGLLSLSAHKMYGPKGAGALYIQKRIGILPMFWGGRQEKNIRSGTENVAAVVGMGRACELAMMEWEMESKRLAGLRDLLQDRIMKRLPETTLNGHRENRLPHVLSLSVPNITGVDVVQEMDRSGFALSAGSACASNKVEVSHVLSAMGNPIERAKGTVRFSLGRRNTKRQMIRTADAFTEIVEKLKVRAELEASLGTRRCY